MKFYLVTFIACKIYIAIGAHVSVRRILEPLLWETFYKLQLTLG